MLPLPVNLIRRDFLIGTHPLTQKTRDLRWQWHSITVTKYTTSALVGT